MALVLLVEDEKYLAGPLLKELQIKKYKTLHAKNGEEGLKYAIDRQPDIILLDLMMPVMDGATMLEKLRQTDYGKSAKIMVMSNMNDPKTAGFTAGLGVLDYIVKSDWKLKDIIERIKINLK